MALQHCTACTTNYALGLTVCPHCRQPAHATVTLPAHPLGQVAAAEVDHAEPTPRRRPRRADPPAETGDAQASTDD